MEWMLKRRFIIRAAQRPGGDNSRKWLYSKRERQWRRRTRRRIVPLVWCRTLKPGPRDPESSSLASLDKIPKVMVARDDASARLFVHQMECLTNRVTDNEESKTVLALPFFPVSLFNVPCFHHTVCVCLCWSPSLSWKICVRTDLTVGVYTYMDMIIIIIIWCFPIGRFWLHLTEIE